MTNRIRTEIKDGVADVRLIRGDKMNALDDAMFQALIEVPADLAANPAVRCVVLSGEGRAFCAGLDMGNFAAMGSSAGARSSGEVTGRRLTPRTHGLTNRAQQAVWGWRDLPVPVIAAVHGVAFGGGLQVSLGADIRIVHPETKLSVMEIRWGLIPDMAGTAILRNLVRDDVLRELTYTGRVFSGTEAVAYGFATRTCENPLDTALGLAHEIASKSPSAIEAGKRIYNRLGDLTDAEALLQESEVQDTLMGRANQIEAVLSQLEKRDPNFENAR